MAILNSKPNNIYTAEGARACHINPELQLRRSVMSCLLFESNFYESGVEISERIKSLIPLVDPKICGKIAVEAREKAGLRHVPLLILREMARLTTHKRYVSRGLQRVITRPDQLTDFLALYLSTNDGKKTLTAKVKDGLARAFIKFNEYELRKHAHDDRAVKLKDVMFLCHPKPKDAEQEAMWKRLIAGELAPVDTWETQLSAGADKKETFERLMKEKKLGPLAFVRNLRNMHEAGVAREDIRDYANHIDVSKVFPWQFIAAAKFAPWYEQELETCMLRSLVGRPKLLGKTILLIDHSGSMGSKLSTKGEMTYSDAACGVAMMLRELCDDVNIYSFSHQTVFIPSRHGFALRDAIRGSQTMGGTYLGQSIKNVADHEKSWDRLIVITDEQSHDTIVWPNIGKQYVVNVASNKNGVGYGQTIHIDGFSSHVLDWIKLDEEISCE
jgi:60 kDa SS-A/Ro ribonucleoprotein